MMWCTAITFPRFKIKAHGSKTYDDDKLHCSMRVDWITVYCNWGCFHFHRALGFEPWPVLVLGQQNETSQSKHPPTGFSAIGVFSSFKHQKPASLLMWTICCSPPGCVSVRALMAVGFSQVKIRPNLSNVSKSPSTSPNGSIEFNQLDHPNERSSHDLEFVINTN